MMAVFCRFLDSFADLRACNVTSISAKLHQNITFKMKTGFLVVFKEPYCLRKFGGAVLVSPFWKFSVHSVSVYFEKR